MAIPVLNILRAHFGKKDPSCLHFNNQFFLYLYEVLAKKLYSYLEEQFIYTGCEKHGKDGKSVPFPLDQVI